jgi:hypothetical protein
VKVNETLAKGGKFLLRDLPSIDESNLIFSLSISFSNTRKIKQ